MPAFLLPMLLKGFGFVKEAIKAAIGFIARHPWQSAAVFLLVACAWLWRANNGLEDAIKAERAAHVQTVANFKKAQADAEAKQAHNLARVAKAQKDVTDETLDDYNRRVADLRERYKRLQSQGNRSATRDPDLPAVPGTAARLDEAPRENGLPSPDALIASEQALQLDALITWNERQAKIETSPGDE